MTSDTNNTEAREQVEGTPAKIAEKYPIVAEKSQKRYREYTGDDGKEYREWEDGLLQRRNGKGVWVFAPGTGKNPSWTSETGREIAEERWEGYRRASLEGLMEATGTELPNDAVRQLVQVYSGHAMAGGRGGAAYAREVREMAQLVPPRNGGVKLTDGSGQSIEAGSVAELRQVGDWLRQLRADRE